MTFHRLRDFLAKNKWKEADTETARLLFDLQGDSFYEGESLYLSTIKSFSSISCEDLHEINQLWVDYSQGHFGLSVQKEIYQHIGVTREYNAQTWQRFGDAVGWRVKNQWGSSTFDLQAPRGHLPIMSFYMVGNAYDDRGRMDEWYGWSLGTSGYYSEASGGRWWDVSDQSHARFSSFMSRVVECHINPQDLVQASQDIKTLLEQLSLKYPLDSLRVLGAKAVDQVEENPELKSRILRGVTKSSFAALEKMIDHPVAKFFIIFIEGEKEVLKP